MTVPAVPVPVSYRTAILLTVALENHAKTFDELADGPTANAAACAARAAEYRRIAEDFYAAAVAALRIDPEAARADLYRDERSPAR